MWISAAEGYTRLLDDLQSIQFSQPIERSASWMALAYASTFAAFSCRIYKSSSVPARLPQMILLVAVAEYIYIYYTFLYSIHNFIYTICYIHIFQLKHGLEFGDVFSCIEALNGSIASKLGGKREDPLKPGCDLKDVQCSGEGK